MIKHRRYQASTDESIPESSDLFMEKAEKWGVKVLFGKGDILHCDQVKLTPKYS
jgi:hypothetical protein